MPLGEKVNCYKCKKEETFMWHSSNKGILCNECNEAEVSSGVKVKEEQNEKIQELMQEKPKDKPVEKPKEEPKISLQVEKNKSQPKKNTRSKTNRSCKNRQNQNSASKIPANKMKGRRSLFKKNPKNEKLQELMQEKPKDKPVEKPKEEPKISLQVEKNKSQPKKNTRSKTNQSCKNRQNQNSASKIPANKMKGRRSLFKKTPVKLPSARATCRTVPEVNHKGQRYKIGDIVSVRGTDLQIYYAQIKGLMVDEYCEKSASICWLLPVRTESPYTRQGFDPMTYVIGPDDDLPRKIECFEFVMHAPSDYFRNNCPYPSEGPAPLAPGYLWTRLNKTTVPNRRVTRNRHHNV